MEGLGWKWGFVQLVNGRVQGEEDFHQNQSWHETLLVNKSGLLFVCLFLTPHASGLTFQRCTDNICHILLANAIPVVLGSTDWTTVLTRLIS